MSTNLFHDNPTKERATETQLTYDESSLIIERKLINIINIFTTILTIFLFITFSKNTESCDNSVYVRKKINEIPFLYEHRDKISCKKLDGWSNNIFLIDLSAELNHKFILRIPIKNSTKFKFKINSDFEYINTSRIYHLNIGPRIIYFDSSDDTFLFEYIENIKELQEDDFKDINTIVSVVNILKKLHESKVRFVNTKDIFLELRKAHDIVKVNYINNLPDNINNVQNILHTIEDIYKKLEVSFVACHNDPNPNNFLLTNHGLKLIDWEYSGNNDPAWDLAYLSTAAKFNTSQDLLLLKFYNDRSDTTLYERFVIFKAFAQLWRFYWLRFQPLIYNSVATKDEFINFSNEMYHICENIINSIEFKMCYKRLLRIAVGKSKNTDNNGYRYDSLIDHDLILHIYLSIIEYGLLKEWVLEIALRN